MHELDDNAALREYVDRGSEPAFATLVSRHINMVYSKCIIEIGRPFTLTKPMLIRLIPKIFYNRMEEGLDLFVNCLGFTVLHQDGDLAVVGRDGAKAYVMESPEYAAKDRPEVAIETDNIEEIYQEIAARRPEMLHPNLPRVTKRPWGALEFAVLDKTTVCVVFRQWPK